MPAIQVARTDTFEVQRQKINEISSQLFSISQGETVLSTNNLKLGDGSLSEPSLSFEAENNLGLYRSSPKILSFVSDSKKVLDIKFSEVTNYKNFNIKNNSLTTSGTIIVNPGANYDPGSYTSVLLSGGSGSGATANITVSPYTGSIASSGSNYNSGSYSNVLLNGGTGSGSSITFSVNQITGIITPGSGYIDGEYNSISPDTTGSGSGMVINVTVSGGGVTLVDFIDDGQNYEFGDIITVNNSLLGGSGSGFSFEITSNPGKILSVTFDSYGSGYTEGDVLSLPTSVSGITATVTGDQLTNLSSIDEIRSGYYVTITSGTASINTLTVVDNIDEVNQVITINTAALVDGDATLTFTPPWGDPIDAFSYIIGDYGIITNLTIANPGSGYEVNDILNVNAEDLTSKITYFVAVRDVLEITFTDTYPIGTFSTTDTLKLLDGGVSSFVITSSTQILSEANQSYSGVLSLNGTGSDASFDVVRDASGIADVTINNPGNSYTIGDILTIPGNLVGGQILTDDITIEVAEITQQLSSQIYKVISSGGNITSLIIEYNNSQNWQSGNFVVKNADNSVIYTLSTVGSLEKRYFIDIGSGLVITPNITLYSGNTYVFDYSDTSNINYGFSVSKFPDGKWDPSLVSNIFTTLSTSSRQITVSDTTGIQAEMLVSVISGVGSLPTNIFVESVDSQTQLTLSDFPSVDGFVTLNFYGGEYFNGITKTSNQLQIKISDDTPNLYYYSNTESNLGGRNGAEALLTTDNNNPKIFGSGASFSVFAINSQDVIKLNVADGSIDAISGVYQNISGTEANLTNLSSTSVTAQSILDLSNITSDNLTITSPENYISGNLDIGNNLSIVSSSGNITTSGELKSAGSINSNDRLVIQNETIRTNTGYDLILQPASGFISKVNSNTAFIIPSGNTSQRPLNVGAGGLAQDGAIRYNTDTTQYEGYSSASNSWASLGGVRDIDGNTYILAELLPGQNDNTLWFYNDGSNSLRLTTQFLDFQNVKKISSAKQNLPEFSLWTQNLPVLENEYLKYKNNIYVVTLSGTTGSSPPVHTSGYLLNGTCELTWYSLSVAPLEFTEIEELRVSPDKDASLVINSSIKIGGVTSQDWNTISTLSEDLIIRPYPGKKVVIDSTSHFAIPSGNENQKSTATAVQGSIRFNTTIGQFEGYSGVTWSSLGGIRDVDGNTYILPESSAGQNDNIFYFYNDNINTIQLSTTTLDFTNIDTITTSGLSNLAIDTPLLTLNGNETTIDNRDLTRTFISTAKQYLDLGLSSGLVVDPVLRLDDQGDVYLNTGFGTGVYNGVKIFDSELKEFELANYIIRTESFTLTKGLSESASEILYKNSLAKGCQLNIISKSSSGEKSLATYNIIDNGSDVFHNEFGSLNTSLDLFNISFEVAQSDDVTVLVTLNDNHDNGDIIEFTLVTKVYK